MLLNMAEKGAMPPAVMIISPHTRLRIKLKLQGS